jgi:Domain of unknown function (DUF4157)
VFAPKIAKPQTKAAEGPTSRLAPHRSTPMGPRLGHEPVEQALLLQRTIGNQATLRYLSHRLSNLPAKGRTERHEQEATTENITARGATPGVSWDFAKIPIFPLERGSRSQGSSAQPSIIQPKLFIGQANDLLEHEANHVADQVMRMPDPEFSVTPAPAQLSRTCAACEDEQRGKLQTKPAGALVTGTDEIQFDRTAATSESVRDGSRLAPAIVREVLATPGEPLDRAARAFFEPRFGHDFSAVRIHNDSKAAESARATNALAYTVGSHVVFGAGQPSREFEGQRMVAHELTHVVQQAAIGARVQRQDAATEATPASSSGCRKITQIPCPGTKGQFTAIEYFARMLLTNVGECGLYVGGIDASGNIIDPTREHFFLAPGDSRTFFPPAGAVAVSVGCDTSCSGSGQLEHPYLCA